ncbi:hypothetical protein [Halalkalibacter alkalisediminis]|uniref:Lipoprotein n=1 Tax=Halalkalibacter alkalisediminis TaxID=935616 RepID=A0ABV6NNF8_9BACI|nr:hypothetical protein [Halalkalibacter alkalisediminis]
MSKFLAILFLFFLLVGCSTEEEKVIERLKPEEENRFSVRVFVDKTPSEEYQRSILDIFDEQSLWGEKITSHGFTIIDEESTHSDDYIKIFDLKKFPGIIVFNHDGVAFRTYEVEELRVFFLNQ